MSRYISVDILRGVAILLMIQVHFVDDLSSKEEPWEWQYSVSSVLGMLPAPFFTFVVGVSFSLWTRKLRASGAKDSAITGAALRRGLFLFAVGLAFNFAVWLPEETFNWDILTLLGGALMVLAFARHLPTEVIGLMCALIVLMSPPLRVMSEYDTYWKDGAFDYDVEFRAVFLGFFVNGYFPVFPWLMFPMAGFIVGEAVFGARRSRMPLVWLAAIGIGMMIVAAFAHFFRDVLPNAYAEPANSMYPATTAYVLGTLGLTILCLAIFRYWCDDSNKPPGIVIAFLQRWSVFSFTVYIVHQVVHLWPLWLYGIWMGHEDPTHYWRQAMSTPLALGLALAFVVLFTPVLHWLERHKNFSLEGIMRRACD